MKKNERTDLILNSDDKRVNEYRRKTANPREKVFLTLDDVAGILGIRRITAYRMVRSGQIRAGKHGGSWKVYIDDILAYHDSMCRLAEEERLKK